MYGIENILDVFAAESENICKAVFSLYLIVLSVMDIKWKKIYVPVLMSGIMILIWGRISMNQISVISSFFGGAAGALFIIISMATKESFGYGDSILITISGFFLGFWNILYVLFGAFSIAAVFSIFLLVYKKFSKKTSFPFIPFFTAAYIGGMLVGIY